MSSFYYGAQQHNSHQSMHSSHPHHSGRSRRSTRTTGYHARNEQKQMRAIQMKKEAAVETALELNFRRDFEAARSFEIEDDEMFCPFHLLTEDDLHSIHSSGSDRSSLSSGSPDHSPLQHQLQPTSNFLLPPSAGNFNPSSYANQSSSSVNQTKIHAPLAQRTRNAIPIVDPSTRNVASPPPSVSPARMTQQFINQRRWA